MIEAAKTLYAAIGDAANIVTKNTMLSLYVNQGMIEEAKTLYAAIGDAADIVTKTTMLNLYANLGEIVVAKEFYRNIEDQASIATKTTMLKLYANQGMIEEAKTLYAAIGDAADIVTKTTMLSMYVKKGMIEEAKTLYAFIGDAANIVTKNTMLSLYVNQGMIEAAKTLYVDIGSEADIVTKNTMLSLYANQGMIEAAKTLYADIGNEADIITKTTMLNLYVNLGEIVVAEEFYRNIEDQASIVTKTTMLKLYANQCQTVAAAKLYADIGREANIVTKNTMLSMYVKLGMIEEAKTLYAAIGDAADIVTKNIILSMYAKEGNYAAAEKLYEAIGHAADIVTKNTMLKLLAKQDKFDEALELYQAIPNTEKTLNTHAEMLRIIIRHINPKRYHTMISIADHYEQAILAKKDNITYCAHYTILASHYHTFVEKVAYSKDQQLLKTYRDKVLSILNHLYDHVPPDQLTMKLAWLFSLYFKEKEFSPKHTPLSLEQIETIKIKASKQLDHPLTPLNESNTIRIKKVNALGKTLGEYQINDSIYQAIAPGITDYLIVEFDRPQKASRLPPFIQHEGKYYRTDVFGGTKLKTKMSENNFGSMIAIPIESSEFFKTWLTFDESFWYGQRAFLPEEANQANKGLRGRFQIALIPDSMNFSIIAPFIVQDGCGYIKESAADKMGIKAPAPLQSLPTSYLTYQATQSYESSGQIRVVEELIHHSMPRITPAVSALEQKQVPDEPTLETLYPAITVGLPNHMGVAIPVSGEKVYFGAQTPWQSYANEKEGIIIGRNPYDAKKLQFAEIAFSQDLGKLRCMQYTLTGYSSGDQTPIGRFFKGLLVVVPDDKWPEEYSNCELLVSAKDEKLNQTWRDEAAKKSAQNSTKPTVINLCGMLVVKQEYPRGKLIGVPKPIAEVSAGDFDGDEYNVIAAKGLKLFKEMIINGSQDSIPNPKIPKTFTPRTNISNFAKIMALRKPLLERWVTIQNVIYSLSASERAAFAADITVEHALEKILGTEWLKKLGLNTDSPTPVQIMIAEIQIGIKCGEDAPKTKVPTAVLDERSLSYMRLFTKWKISVSVPYAKGYKKRFFSAATTSFEAFEIQLMKPFEATKSHNIVHKTQRGLLRFLTHQKAANGHIVSDDENEGMTLSSATMETSNGANEKPSAETQAALESQHSFGMFTSTSTSLSNVDVNCKNETVEFEGFPNLNNDSSLEELDFDIFWDNALKKVANQS